MYDTHQKNEKILWLTRTDVATFSDWTRVEHEKRLESSPIQSMDTNSSS
jgi:hypothetical protein